MTVRMHRRKYLKTIAATAGLLAAPAFVRAQGSVKGTGEVRVASLGGSFEDAQNKSVFEPFEKESGIKIRLIAYSGPSQVVAQQRTGNIEWDAIIMSKSLLP